MRGRRVEAFASAFACAVAPAPQRHTTTSRESRTQDRIDMIEEPRKNCVMRCVETLENT